MPGPNGGGPGPQPGEGGEGGGDSGTGTREIPTGAVNGVNTTFTFTAPPVTVYRNGVMETRLGTVVGNTFVFDIPPTAGDDPDEIEGVV